jgi:hypothetical protein
MKRTAQRRLYSGLFSTVLMVGYDVQGLGIDAADNYRGYREARGRCWRS